MNLNLISRKVRSNKKALTLVELVLASFFMMLLLISATAILFFESRFYMISTARIGLQWEANLIIDRLLRGENAGGGRAIGLSEAVDTAPHPFLSSPNINFRSLNDATAIRSYRLGPTNTSIIYNDGTSDHTIYSIANINGASINALLFAQPDNIAGNAVWPNIEIFVTLQRNIGDTTITASAQTIINIRNYKP